MQTEHVLMHLGIRLVRHVRSDCTKKVCQCYSLAVRLSSAEAMCRARYGKTRLFQKEIGDRLSLLQMLLGMRSQEMPPCSSVSLPLFPIPPYSLYPFFPFVLLSCTHHTFLPDCGCFWRLRGRPACYRRNVWILPCKLVCICSV